MAYLRAKSLQVVGFRGITQSLEMRFGSRLTIVYGGNATGKSSIAQAIEFALSGQVLDHDYNPIPARYLGSLRKTAAGSVNLTLTDNSKDFPLDAKTDEGRHQIESRFRHVADVDWPDRQLVPITTTHITTQGALARVVGADSVTRNDLSGLCTGTYLRFLLGRAQRLSDHFRQAATGRNMQAAINDARAAYEAARVLRDSLAATRTATLDTSVDRPQLIRTLALDAELPETSDLRTVVETINRRNEELEQKLSATERLLARMGELGKYEVELSQLRDLVNSSVIEEIDLAARKDQANSTLRMHREIEATAVATRTAAVATLAAHERYEQSAAAIASLMSRLADVGGSAKNASDSLASVQTALQQAASEQRDKSEMLVHLRSRQRRLDEQLKAVTEGLSILSVIPEQVVDEAKLRVLEAERIVAGLQNEETKAGAQLAEGRRLEAIAEEQLRRTSERDSELLSAVAELMSLIDDDACSLCGHRHGSREALDTAINAVAEKRLTTSRDQRSGFEQVTAARRDLAAAHARLASQLQTAKLAMSQAQQSLERLQTQRATNLAQVRTLLSRNGSDIVLTDEILGKTQNDLAGSLEQMRTEIDPAMLADKESTNIRHDLEEELAKRTVERDQLIRLATELERQIAALRSDQPDIVPSDILVTARRDLGAADSVSAEARRSIGSATAALSEIDRLLASRTAQRASAQRQLEVIEGQLRSLDTDLKEVGAGRDIAALLRLEADTRRQRDNNASLKAKAASISERLRELERYSAYTASDERFQAALAKLEKLQVRQATVSRRADQFSNLQRELEQVQSATAEAVLRNVRAPVGLMFRAMTAGCQWDMEFALTEAGRVEARLLDGTGNAAPATAVLNSAYLNVSAIALRVALASQQNWTSLRTVVLDDPILEMDSLTQSALLDGLEAVLTSPDPPWNNLQFIVTTWSEDFAVLAAHKLAHMNRDGSNSDGFVVYHLRSQPDGTVSPERHAPRWRDQATAA